MKKILSAVVASAFLVSLCLPAFAAEEQTIKGEAMCAKCSMHDTAKCQCAIKTADGTVYYADNNTVAKDFHENICKANAQVTATGVVTEKDGKKTIKLSKIDTAK